MTNRENANIQDLLKVIAIVAMVCDHLGLYFFPECQILRVIGRIVMPVFCFFVGYNYIKPKPLILVAGIVINIVGYICFEHIGLLNMLIGIYIAQVVLYLIDKYSVWNDNNILLIFCTLLALAPITMYFFDYGTLGTAFAVIGRYYKKKEGIGFMPVLCFSTIIFSIYNFTKFTIADDVMTIFLVCGICYTISRRNYTVPIAVDLRLLSRNSLVFYFAHLVAMIIVCKLMHG